MKKSLGIIGLIIFSFLFFCGCSKEDNKDVEVNSPPPPPPPPFNTAPTANGGPNFTIYVPRDSVSIDARKSKDVDGAIVSYSLTQISGPAPTTIEKDASLIAIHRVKRLNAGTYIFELRVTDNNGATGTANIQVDVIQGPPSGTEYVLDSLVWDYSWDDYAHILQTPERPDIFPNNFSFSDSLLFPADIYLRYDTATLWSKLPPINTKDDVNYMALSMNKKIVYVIDWGPRNLYGRKASLRVKFH